jgi:hypothetical protein
MESASRAITKSSRAIQGSGIKGRQIKTPTIVPAVPGATGESPEPNPVARNVISFSFKISPETNKKLDNRTIVLYHRCNESQANFTGCGEKNHRLFSG